MLQLLTWLGWKFYGMVLFAIALTILLMVHRALLAR